MPALLVSYCLGEREVMSRNQWTRKQWIAAFRSGDKDMKGADLSGLANDEVEMTDIDFEGADLRDAILCHSIIKGCNFNKANMAGADLAYAIIENSTFCEAELKDADMSCAAVRFCDFDGSTVDSAVTYRRKGDIYES